MAKKRNPMENTLPRLRRDEAEMQEEQLATPPPEDAEGAAEDTPETASPPECHMVSLTLPMLGESVHRSFQDETVRVDMKGISRERLRKLKALRRGLIASGACLSGGHELRTNRDAIYYFLDQLEIG